MEQVFAWAVLRLVHVLKDRHPPPRPRGSREGGEADVAQVETKERFGVGQSPGDERNSWRRDAAGSLDWTWGGIAGGVGRGRDGCQIPTYSLGGWRGAFQKGAPSEQMSGWNLAAGSGRQFREVWGTDATLRLQGWAAFEPEHPKERGESEERKEGAARIGPGTTLDGKEGRTGRKD